LRHSFSSKRLLKSLSVSARGIRRSSRRCSTPTAPSSDSVTRPAVLFYICAALSAARAITWSI
jgi:hypothetical protein